MHVKDCHHHESLDHLRPEHRTCGSWSLTCTEGFAAVSDAVLTEGGSELEGQRTHGDGHRGRARLRRMYRIARQEGSSGRRDVAGGGQAIGVSILMHGGPATIYGARAFSAFNGRSEQVSLNEWRKHENRCSTSHPNVRRVLGPFFTIVVAGLARHGYAVSCCRVHRERRARPWFTEAFMLAGGISIVAFHQIWKGLAAIIVSVLGGWWYVGFCSSPFQVSSPLLLIG